MLKVMLGKEILYFCVLSCDATGLAVSFTAVFKEDGGDHSNVY